MVIEKKPVQQKAEKPCSECGLVPGVTGDYPEGEPVDGGFEIGGYDDPELAKMYGFTQRDMLVAAAMAYETEGLSWIMRDNDLLPGEFLKVFELALAGLRGRPIPRAQGYVPTLADLDAGGDDD